MSPTILSNIFASRVIPYSVRNPVSFKMPKGYSVYNITKTLSQLGAKSGA